METMAEMTEAMRDVGDDMRMIPQFRAMFDDMIYRTHYDKAQGCLAWTPLIFSKGAPLIRDGGLVRDDSGEVMRIMMPSPMWMSEISEVTPGSDVPDVEVKDDTQTQQDAAQMIPDAD